jgi:hypothetical protein
MGKATGPQNQKGVQKLAPQFWAHGSLCPFFSLVCTFWASWCRESLKVRLRPSFFQERSYGSGGRKLVWWALCVLWFRPEEGSKNVYRKLDFWAITSVCLYWNSSLASMVLRLRLYLFLVVIFHLLQGVEAPPFFTFFLVVLFFSFKGLEASNAFTIFRVVLFL